MSRDPEAIRHGPPTLTGASVAAVVSGGPVCQDQPSKLRRETERSPESVPAEGAPAPSGVTGEGSTETTETWGSFVPVRCLPRSRRTAVAGAACAGCLLAVPVALSSAPSSGAVVRPAASGGGTAYLAEAPGSTPQDIFIMGPPQYNTVPNIDLFVDLMYRPLIAMGKGTVAVPNPALSLVDTPTYSNHDRTVTLHLRNYRWSDGEVLQARDVTFFLNLVKADKAEWADYVPGEFPDNISSATIANSKTVVLHLTSSLDPTWFTDNELTQITPLPLAWDITAYPRGVTASRGTLPVPPASAKLPDETPAGAAAVYKFLNAQATNKADYATSPIWSVIDGPWKLSSLTTDGEATFVPNPRYTGADKPRLAQFVELPFTSDTAEFDALRSSSQLDVGYLPYQDVAERSLVESSGYNVVASYNLDVNFFFANFRNPTVGPVFSQLYFRAAFQHLIDEPGWIKAFFGGVALPTNGPVPLEKPFADAQERAGNPYPFSVSAAKHLLLEHGWDVVPNGLTTCTRPGTGSSDCGAGIKKGLGLQFNLDYASGVTPVAESMAEVGIKVALTSRPFGNVIQRLAGCPKAGGSGCGWTIENWGAGVTFNGYPSGESLFSSTAVENFAGYSNATTDRLIKAVTTAPASQSQAALDAYQNWVAKQVPGFWQPLAAQNYANGLVVISDKLKGYVPNPYDFINPSLWSLAS
jgi:peptide/nickel transport system substrate-binding protein